MSAPPVASGSNRWVEQHAIDYDWAKEIFLAKGELAPMFVVRAGDKALFHLADINSERTQERCVHGIRMLAVANDSECVSFFSEMWCRNAIQAPDETSEQVIERVTAVPVEEAEDRMEAILVTMEYRDSADERHTLFSIGSIERGPDGKPSGVTDMTPDALQSRQVLFEDLLPPGRPTALQRELARALLKRLGFGQVSLNEIN